MIDHQAGNIFCITSPKSSGITCVTNNQICTEPRRILQAFSLPITRSPDHRFSCLSICVHLRKSAAKFSVLPPWVFAFAVVAFTLKIFSVPPCLRGDPLPLVVALLRCVTSPVRQQALHLAQPWSGPAVCLLWRAAGSPATSGLGKVICRRQAYRSCEFHCPPSNKSALAGRL